ncbi:hypothetical protein LXL04_004432 [Taraxacum kok-saghyz]
MGGRRRRWEGDPGIAEMEEAMVFLCRAREEKRPLSKNLAVIKTLVKRNGITASLLHFVHPPAHSARTLDRCFISLILTTGAGFRARGYEASTALVAAFSLLSNTLQSAPRFLLGFRLSAITASCQELPSLSSRFQNKKERATKRAQEQFQTVLEKQNRFALDIDLDVPATR